MNDLWRRAGDAVSAIVLKFHSSPELGLTTRAYREPDSHDQRQLIRLIGIRPKAIESIQAVHAPMQKSMFKLWSGYSARDLENDLRLYNAKYSAIPGILRKNSERWCSFFQGGEWREGIFTA